MTKKLLEKGDEVRWAEAWLRSISVEPQPNRPIGFITIADIRAGNMTYEVCFESSLGVSYVLASADMLEPAVNA